MSHVVELAGFGLIAYAAACLFGVGVALATGGVCLLVVAQGVDDGAVKAAGRRAVRLVSRRKS